MLRVFMNLKKVLKNNHNIIHVNEPYYFSLRNLFNKAGFKGKIKSTNIAISMPIQAGKVSCLIQ